MPIDTCGEQMDAASGGTSEEREATGESFRMDQQGVLARCDVMADGDQDRIGWGVERRNRIPGPVVDLRPDPRGLQT